MNRGVDEGVEQSATPSSLTSTSGPESGDSVPDAGACDCSGRTRFRSAPEPYDRARILKNRSIASIPILACSSATVGPGSDDFFPPRENTSSACESNCCFHCTIRVGWTSNCSAIRSAFGPRESPLTPPLP